MNFLNKDDLKKLIAFNQIEEAIKSLGEYLNSIGGNDDFNVLSSRFYQYKKDAKLNKKSNEALKIEHINISYGLLDLINSLDHHLQVMTTRYSDQDIAPKSLFDRIFSEDKWEELLKCARDAVVAGGISAMGYYNASWDSTKNVGKDLKNPSTNADVEATVALLKNIDSTLPNLCDSLKCDLQYFGEETTSKTQTLVVEKLSPLISSKIKGVEQFFSEKKNTIRVIFDAIDGTENFKKQFPVFCSALAILVNNQPRISAIYDPVHHIVYTGLIAGPEKYPMKNSTGSVWHVSIGQRIEMSKVDKNKKLANESIGIHFTRSLKNRKQLKEMINHVENLVEVSAGVQSINSGLVSLKDVARGVLGGFINNRTHPWDVVAGEVLVKVVGGEVTKLDGTPLDYSIPGPISVLAASTESLHKEILKVVK